MSKDINGGQNKRTSKTNLHDMTVTCKSDQGTTGEEQSLCLPAELLKEMACAQAMHAYVCGKSCAYSCSKQVNTPPKSESNCLTSCVAVRKNKRNGSLVFPACFST